jgi:glycosyltransferase involved in cell wall biosynthesis
MKKRFARRALEDGKKHVIFTSAWFPSTTSTSGIFVKEQAEALARRGNTVAALIVDPDNLRSLVNRGPRDRHRYLPSDVVTMLQPRILFPVPYRFLADPEQSYRRHIEMAAIRAVERQVARHGPIDVVHHHCLSDNSYVARALAEHFGVPYVFTEYSNYWTYEELRKFNRFESEAEHRDFVRSAEARIAAAQVRAEGYRGIFGAEFECIPNLVSELFEAPLPNWKDRSRFQFVCAAVLDDRKRQDLLLRAFASEFKGKPATLTFVGNGPRQEDYRALAVSLGLADQVIFAGIQHREQVRAQFDAAHVQVLASEQETFGVVLAEALFRGIPVISTRSGGPEEIIGPGRGLLTPVGDERAMAAALREIHDTYSSYDPEGMRAWARSMYSENVVAAQIEAVYDRICGQVDRYSLRGRKHA